MAGYLDDPEAQRRAPARRPTIAPRTWRRATPTATYWYVGRADDVFKSSDYRISPFELESALIEHGSVAEAAVVPSPDPIRLERPQGLGGARSPASSPRRPPRTPSSASYASGSRPTRASGASNSPSCRRPSPARSAASSSAPWKKSAHAAGVRGEHEYWEDDFIDFD